MKLAALVCASFALVSATKPAQRLGPGDLYTQVNQVVCNEGKGTAFDIADGRMVSVAHVTKLTNCQIDGKAIDAKSEAGLDFSVIKAAQREGFPINCEGFKPGEWYFAIGHAKGWQWQTMMRLMATYQTESGQTELLGPPQVIPGMSGGPVLNAKGEVVGTVNRYHNFFPLSYSQPLKGTSLCAG
jgi:hypothetical protein